MRHANAPQHSQRRRGVALLLALLAILIIGALIGTTSWQIMANRRLTRMRQNELQATWLARAGVELACAHLLSEPTGYTGESVQPLPQARVDIRVKTQKNSPDRFEITSEARYPVEHSDEMRRSLSCRIKRSTSAGQTRIEMETPVGPTDD